MKMGTMAIVKRRDNVSTDQRPIEKKGVFNVFRTKTKKNKDKRDQNEF